MNKLTKLGVSALCGSLAAISTANAGDLTVTGGVDMSWISLSDEVVGNPIGMGSNLTFSGSGELDNGWAVGIDILVTNTPVISRINNTNIIPEPGIVVSKLNITSGRYCCGIRLLISSRKDLITMTVKIRGIQKRRPEIK